MDRTLIAYINNNSDYANGSSLYGIFKVVVDKPLNGTGEHNEQLSSKESEWSRDT